MMQAMLHKLCRRDV